MNKVQCYKCKSTPLTIPMGELGDYYVMNEHIIICEKCLKEIVQNEWENQDIETK